MSNYVGCSQYSIFCYVVFLKIVDLKNITVLLLFCWISSKKETLRHTWRYCMSDPEKFFSLSLDLLILVWEIVQVAVIYALYS